MFRYSDTVHGGQAKATAIINGRVEEMFYIRKLEATSEKNKKEGAVLGDRVMQHKAAGLTNTGSMTIYDVTSLFRKMMKEYQDTGRDTYFTITVETYDEGSTIGRQVATLFDVNIDSVVVANVDVEATALETDVNFTFGRWELLEEYQLPA